MRFFAITRFFKFWEAAEIEGSTKTRGKSLHTVRESSHFMKHVFKNERCFEGQFVVRLKDSRTQKMTLLKMAKTTMPLFRLKISVTFLPPKYQDIFTQLHRFPTLDPSREGLSGVRS